MSDEGRVLRVGPNRIAIKLQKEYSIIEYTVAPRFVAPPVLHWHEDTDFTAILIEGSLVFRFENETRTIHPGDLLHVPRNTKFAWANPEDATARVYFVYYPAGFERYFIEVEALLTANPGKTIPDLMSQIMPLWEKYRIARDE